MIGDPAKNDKNFTLEKYEDFYEHHTFEEIPEKLCLTVNEFIPRFGWAFDEVEALKTKSLLDLGCLDGSFALSVAKQLGIPVVGIDLTTDGIQIAKERAKKYGLAAEFYQGSIEEQLVKFAEEGRVFDVVSMFELIEHVKDVQLILKLIDDVLKADGSVLVSTPAFEGPLYGLDDENNKCHIRLYTTAEVDYWKENKHGNVRKATSISKEIGADRIKEVAVHNHIINLRYE